MGVYCDHNQNQTTQLIGEQVYFPREKGGYSLVNCTSQGNTCLFHSLAFKRRQDDCFFFFFVSEYSWSSSYACLFKFLLYSPGWPLMRVTPAPASRGTELWAY